MSALKVVVVRVMDQDDVISYSIYHSQQIACTYYVFDITIHFNYDTCHYSVIPEVDEDCSCTSSMMLYG